MSPAWIAVRTKTRCPRNCRGRQLAPYPPRFSGCSEAPRILAAVLWGVLSPSSTIPTEQPTTYVPRGANILRRIFHDHFPAFVQSYDSLDAQDYGKFRLERISRVAERFESCSDYTPAAAGSGPSGIRWSVTPRQDGGRHTVCRAMTRARSHPPTPYPSRLVVPHGRGSSRRSTRSTS